MIQPRPKAGKSSGATTKKKTRASYIRVTCFEEEARLSPSQRDLELEQVVDAMERAIELTPFSVNSVTTNGVRSTGCYR